MMSIMVMDLLDYALIKAGKFRKHIRLFNIREAREQRRMASTKRVVAQTFSKMVSITYLYAKVFI